MLTVKTSHLIVSGAILLLASSVAAVEPLPQPLSLQQALQLSEEHPNIQLAQIGVEKARAEADKISADYGVKVSATAYLTAVDPSDLAFYDRSNNDSKAFLRASKRLYDFGYGKARESAAENAVKSQQWQFLSQRQKHKLGVVEKFFDVLIADKTYVLENEVMTLAFLKYDKAKDHNELGRVSDIDLLELENIYREKLQQRTLAEQEQRLSRSRLAIALGRPDDLPADLVAPEVDWQKPLPTLEAVVDKSLSNNLELRTSRDAVMAAREKLIAAQSKHNPVIHGEMQLAEYNRETASTHPASAGLVLEIPLYTGGASKAEAAHARALLLEQETKLQAIELSIRHVALELLMQLDTLKKNLEALQISSDYSELYLDKNRALYELEVASDFGDAVIKVSQVILDRLQVSLDYALTEARLAALQGEWLEPSTTDSTGRNEQ